MTALKHHPNPDLTVGADNRQRWNRPAHRRHGFHNAHHLFRRAMMVRSRAVLDLAHQPHPALETLPSLQALVRNRAFSALVVARDNSMLFERAAPDFSVLQPHSIQSITKMHMHLIIGRLVQQGLLDLEQPVGHYLADIGTGYAAARLQDLLDMNVANGFTEDYADPTSDCYTEETALGWRLPADGEADVTLREFIHRILGGDLVNRSGYADYKSANTDALTLVCASVSPVLIAAEIEAIADAVGYEGGFHISLSPERLPAFSGGGCLSARDLARFGLLFARGGRDIHGAAFANGDFLAASLARPAPALLPPKDWLKYSNHLMTDGRFVGHGGYGGQFLLVDTLGGAACAFLSVLDNEAGYDDGYMAAVADMLKEACLAVS